MKKVLECINVGYIENRHAKDIMQDMLSDGWGIDSIVTMPNTCESWITFYRYEDEKVA